MIVNASENNIKFENIIKSSGFLGQKIYADYISGQSEETNSFYISDNSAFMLSGVNITLCGNPSEEELEEIFEFCNFCGVSSIESENKNLPKKVERQLHIMQYVGKGAKSDKNIVKNDDIYSFIKFCCINFYGLSFDIVYSNFTRKINKGIADIYYIKEGSKIISGAISTQYGEETVYVTFVSTSKQYRGEGMASRVVNHIISENKGKKIVLKCEDNLQQFYEKLGFKEIGKITVYKG